MSSLEIKGFPPGSVIWIRTNEPAKVFASMDERVRRMLLEDYCCIVTTPEVQIEHLDAQKLRMLGLRKIPKPVTEPPLPSPA